MEAFLKGTKIIWSRHMAFWKTNSILGLSSKNVYELMFNMSSQWSRTHIKCLQPASGKCWIVANSWWVSLMRSWTRVRRSHFNHWKAQPAFWEGAEIYPHCDGRGRKAHCPKHLHESRCHRAQSPPQREPDHMPVPLGFLRGLPISFQIKSTSFEVI